MPKKNSARNNGKQFLDTNRRGGRVHETVETISTLAKHPAHADENMGGGGRGAGKRFHHLDFIIPLTQRGSLALAYLSTSEHTSLSLAVTIFDLSQSRLGHTHTHTQTTLRKILVVCVGGGHHHQNTQRIKNQKEKKRRDI